MNKRHPALKIAAAACSVLLVGGYVTYRAIGNPFAPAQPQPAPADAPAEPPAHFVGSKSAEIFHEPAAPAPQQSAAPRRHMGGSKSMRIVDPEDVPKAPKPADPPAPASPTP